MVGHSSILCRVGTPGRWGGGTFIYSYIRRLGSLFEGFKIWNFNILGFFQKNEYFWGYENFVDIILGPPRIGLVLKVISMYFRIFS